MCGSGVPCQHPVSTEHGNKQVSGSEHNDAPGPWPVGGEHGWVLAFAIVNSVLFTAAKSTKMSVQINNVKESAVKAT